MSAQIISMQVPRRRRKAHHRPGAVMSAQIISMQAWRVAHSERPALCSELLRVWVWPVRVWLAWWGVR